MDKSTFTTRFFIEILAGLSGRIFRFYGGIGVGASGYRYKKKDENK
jgi:hypothetical protein